MLSLVSSHMQLHEPAGNMFGKVGTEDFCRSKFIFTRAKHVVRTVQGQRMWKVAFVTISRTHTKLHNTMH